MTTAATIANACKLMHGKSFRLQHLATISALSTKADGMDTTKITELTGMPLSTVRTTLTELETYGLASVIRPASIGFRAGKTTTAWLTPKGAALAKQLTGGHAEQPQ